jgi:S1-C subfamily serine protease
VEPAVYEAFRENVRLLLGSTEFRQAVIGGATPAARPILNPISFSSGGPVARPIASVANSVAAIFTGDGMGTGFLISSDGYLLTNQHVVGEAKYVKVRWPDRSEVVGEVIRSDRRRDVALVKVEANARQPLALRRTGASLGETVFAIGTPLDPKLQGTVTKGIVSASRVFDGFSFVQSDVTINSGNSGGPLIDEKGAVLAITVSGYDVGGAPAGINLFIPIDDALETLALKPAG